MLSACGLGDDGSGDSPGQGDSDAASVMNTPIPMFKSPTPEPTPVATVYAVGRDWNDAQSAAINGLLADEDGAFGIVVMGSDGQVLYSRNAESPFVTASLYKLILMADILHKVDQRELDLNEEIVVRADYYDSGDGTGDTYFTPADVGATSSLREMLVAVGAYSSNVAARNLLDRTSFDSLNETAAEIGMTNTRLFEDPLTYPNWPPQESSDTSAEDAQLITVFVDDLASEDRQVNLTTPLDMALYQQKALAGTLFSPWVSAQIVSILEQQQILDRIPYLLEDDYTVANKPGNLIHVVNDTGIISGSSGDVIVTVLSLGMTWDGRATEVIQRIALVATGETALPPITEESMIDGGAPDTVFGPPPDPTLVITDPTSSEAAD